MASRPVREPKRKLPHRLQSLFYSSNPPATKKLELVHSNPHIYIIDNFLSDGEIDYFDQIITDNESKFCKSYTEDGSRNRVISKERTSTFFHLTKCQDRIVRNVEQRAADIVGVHVQHVEPLQIVRYKENQTFEVHHDSGTLLENGEIQPVDPMRYVTFFVYLNTLPTGLGSTEFPMLGVQVHPRRGSAVLFCNILPDHSPDKRTIHRALPVQAPGLWKYGMNIWISVENQQDYAQMRPSIKAKRKRNDEEAIVDVVQPSLLNKEDARAVCGPSLLRRAEQGTVAYLSNQQKDDYWLESEPRLSTGLPVMDVSSLMATDYSELWSQHEEAVVERSADDKEEFEAEEVEEEDEEEKKESDRMGLVEGVEGELEAGCWNEVEKEAAGEERKEEAEIEVEDVEEEREEEAEEKFGGDALPGEKIQKAVDGEGVGMDEMAGAGEADKVVAEVHSTPREDVAALIEGAAAEEKEIRPSTIGEP